MKAIILAAGRGTRMKEYGEHLPKGMLSFAGKPLLQHQIEALRAGGISKIYVVSGFGREHINLEGVEYFHNEDYATTNMVESLMCARIVLGGDVLVTYADILYTPELVKAMRESPVEIGVAVDASWKEYWRVRYGTPDHDLESLTISDEGLIKDLGRTVETSAGLDHRYIGMIRFGAQGMRDVIAVYDRKKQDGGNWFQSGNEFQQGYMTDLLNDAIVAGLPIHPVIFNGGWLEFDTAEDYEVMTELLASNKLSAFIDLSWSKNDNA